MLHVHHDIFQIVPCPKPHLQFILVGGAITILKNDGVRQWGWDFLIYEMEVIKFHGSKAPTSIKLQFYWWSKCESISTCHVPRMEFHELHRTAVGNDPPIEKQDEFGLLLLSSSLIPITSLGFDCNGVIKIDLWVCIYIYKWGESMTAMLRL